MLRVALVKSISLSLSLRGGSRRVICSSSNCLTGHIITIIKFNLSMPPPNIKSHSRAPVISFKIRRCEMHFSFFNLRLMSAHVIKQQTNSFFPRRSKDSSLFGHTARKSEKVLRHLKNLLQIDLRRCMRLQWKNTSQRWTELVDYFYFPKSQLSALGACVICFARGRWELFGARVVKMHSCWVRCKFNTTFCTHTQTHTGKLCN
jgi:hypothetical protein